jgi:hypothetical protein
MIFNISTERRSIRNYLALFILDIFLLFLDQTKLSFAIGLFIFANIIHSRTFQFFLLKVLTIFLALYLGVSYSISSINAWRETSELLITQTDLTEISSWGVGVTNTEISNLRIDYGLSLFVDFKSVPFYPQDLIEWKKRIEIVDSFFSQSSNMCDMTRWKFDWILIKRDGVPSCLINSERIDVSEYVFVRKLDRG